MIMDEALKRLSVWERIELIVDDGDSFNPIYDGLSPRNILDIPNYNEKLLNAQDKTKLEDSILTGIGLIGGNTCAIGIMEYEFLAGSLGQITGQKIADLIELAGRNGYPLIIFCCSGGARMQEGIYSLMQMAKIATVLNTYKSQIPLYISVLSDPTMGGVTASIGMFADIILAEPHARIGFAGPNIVESLLKRPFSRECQTSESQLKNGFIDAIVDRENLKNTLEKLLNSIKYQKLSLNTSLPIFSFSDTPKAIWEKIKGIRTPARLDNKDYMSKLFTDFIELHGDRVSGDDNTICGGIAYFKGIPVTVISVIKGHDIYDLAKNKFGMISPSGYRKALRLMKLSPRRPIIIFINTPGAYPDEEAEKQGQASAIANCLLGMAGVSAPTLTFITGEGGSGGALALSTSNSVWMLENAVYSVITPEGFASIIFKDESRAEEAANLMKMSAQDLLKNEIIDGIIPEYGGATQEHLDDIVKDMSIVIDNFIRSNYTSSGESIINQKLQKFNKLY